MGTWGVAANGNGVSFGGSREDENILELGRSNNCTTLLIY